MTPSFGPSSSMSPDKTGSRRRRRRHRPSRTTASRPEDLAERISAVADSFRQQKPQLAKRRSPRPVSQRWWMLAGAILLLFMVLGPLILKLR